MGSPTSRLCWSISWENVPHRRWCALQVDRSIPNEHFDFWSYHRELRIAYSTHGLPKMVVTDKGSNFVSKEFEAFLKQNGICHIKTAPFHPSSNGLAERAVHTFKEGMKKLKDGSLETRVSRFLSRYRITPQTSTRVLPTELLLGRKPRSRLDLAYPDISR